MSTKMAKLFGVKTKQDLETFAKEREQMLFNSFEGNLGSPKYYRHEGVAGFQSVPLFLPIAALSVHVFAALVAGKSHEKRYGFRL